jgi:uncharacterized protein YjbI with pentapeptide repeats
MRLSGLKIEKQVVEGADLRHALAQGTLWNEVVFRGTRFTGADLSGSTFKDCTFEKCQMTGGVWTVRMHGCQVIECDLDDSSFVAAYLSKNAFVGCRAQFSNWHRATIVESKMDIDFRGAHLNFASTSDVDWSGSGFWSAMIPLNCAMFTGNTFDERQVRGLAALLLQGKLPEKLVFKVNALTDARARKMVETLVRPGVEVDIKEEAS